MKTIASRVRRLETRAFDQVQGLLFTVSRAAGESEVAASDIHALQEGGYLRRGGVNLIVLDESGEIKNVSDSTRQYLAERRNEVGRQRSR